MSLDKHKTEWRVYSPLQPVLQVLSKHQSEDASVMCGLQGVQKGDALASLLFINVKSFLPSVVMVLVFLGRQKLTKPPKTSPAQ